MTLRLFAALVGLLCLDAASAHAQSAVQVPPCGIGHMEKTVPPIYLPIARAARVSGDVITMVRFNPDGEVA